MSSDSTRPGRERGFSDALYAEAGSDGNGRVGSGTGCAVALSESGSSRSAAALASWLSHSASVATIVLEIAISTVAVDRAHRPVVERAWEACGSRP